LVFYVKSRFVYLSIYLQIWWGSSISSRIKSIFLRILIKL